MYSEILRGSLRARDLELGGALLTNSHTMGEGHGGFECELGATCANHSLTHC